MKQFYEVHDVAEKALARVAFKCTYGQFKVKQNKPAEGGCGKIIECLSKSYLTTFINIFFFKKMKYFFLASNATLLDHLRVDHGLGDTVDHLIVNEEIVCTPKRAFLRTTRKPAKIFSPPMSLSSKEKRAMMASQRQNS